MRIRLQKLISSAGIASRRASEGLILQGRVLVNGLPAELGQTVDTESDLVCIDGVPVNVSGTRTYVMLNKPRGYVSTLRDEKGRPTVAELVADVGKRLYPVGRLDMDSDGLLLMTDDGALANALMHPSFEIGKTYQTIVSGDIASALPILRGPMELDGRLLSKAEIEQIGQDTLRITIHEGRNRQVRRMCDAAGLKVRRLTRVSEGPLQLGTLKPGAWRYLTENEVSMLKDLHFSQEKRSLPADSSEN